MSLSTTKSSLSLLAGNPVQENIASPGASSSSASAAVLPKARHCVVYLGAEAHYDSQMQRITECFNKKSMAVQQANPEGATHFVLLITDSFLKSKERILPLINALADPHFKQRLFPVIMRDSTSAPVSIFSPGEELKYVQYWSDQAKSANANSSDYVHFKKIEENIAPFIRALRDTLMPPLDDLFKTDLAPITDTIEKRSHLLETKRFYFLPPIKAITAQETIIAQLTSLFAKKSVVTLSGNEGMGKTSLAIEYAKNSEIYSKGIFWLDARNEETLQESYRQLAAQLGMNVQQTKDELYKLKNTLLIYDNVSDPSLVTRVPFAHTLIVGTNLSRPDITLKGFTEKDAIRYVIEQLGGSTEEARTLAKLLDNHPEKLTDSIAYIKSSKMSLQNYIHYYQTDKDNLLAKQSASQKAKEVAVLQSQPIAMDLEPVPSSIGKFDKLSVEELSKELKDQGIEIFVSYNWGAIADVEKMDNIFKNLGIILLRDARELQNFDSIREFMKKVIRHADYTFSMVSDKYLKSFNCLFEVVTTLQDPYWKSRLFPIVLSGTTLDDTAILSYQKYWELESERLEKTGGSPAEAAIAREGANKIAAYLRFVIQTQPEPFTDQIDSRFQKTLALMLARQEKLEKKGIYKQAIFHLPMGRNKDFTGRDKEITLLQDSLKRGQYSAITNTGMGGVGKSQLALEYAYRHEKDYEMIYWIRSEDMSTLKSDLRMLGQEMGITEDFLKDDKVISTMKGVLENKKGWLLVFDNAEDPKALGAVLPQKGGHILVTSRNPDWNNPLIIDVFSKEEAIGYLQKISGISGQEEELKSLAEELGYLPLALTQAGAYIRKQQIDVATYRANYKEEQKKMLSQQEKGYPGSVATAWLMSMKKITKEDPNAAKLLNICGFLGPDNIPESLLEAWLKEKNKVDSGLDFHDALRVLESYSLINQKVEQKEGTRKKLISIHRLIQAVTRDECPEEEVINVLELGVGVQNQQFKGDVKTKEEREAGELLVEHARALITHSEEQGMVTEQMWSLMDSIGAFFYRTGDLAEAKEMYQKALKISISYYGTENNQFVALSHNNLGLLLVAQGNLGGAKEMHQESLRIRIACLQTENHLDVAMSYTNLGIVLQRQGDLSQAKEYYQKALNIEITCRETENHPTVAASYLNLGTVLEAQRDFARAKEMWQKALEIQIACYRTENHTDVAATYNNLGALLVTQRDLTGAKEMLQKALEIYIACMGTENHPDVAASYNNLGHVLKVQGDFAGAKEYCQKALKIQIVRLRTENHTDVAASYNNLGAVLQAQGDLAGAKEYYQKALNISIACLEMEYHTDVASSYNNLGNVLHAQGDFAGAKEMIQRALKIWLTCLETENHPNVEASYNDLSVVLQAQGDLARAKEHYQKVLRIRIARLGTENHIDVASSYDNLGNLLQAQGDFTGAKEHYQKALNIKIASLRTENHVEIAYSYDTLGSLLKAQNDPESAKEYFEKALKIKIACFETENHNDVASSYCELAQVLMNQNDLGAAKAYYEKALKICLTIYATEDHLNVADVYDNLGLVLYDQEDLAGAKEHYQKVLKIRIASLGTEDHLDVAATYNNLGLVLQGQEDFDGAKEHYQKALNIKIASLGTENHDDIADGYNKMGSVLNAQNDLASAKEYFEKALKIYLTIYRTEDHLNVADVYDNLGLVLYDQEDFAGAKEHYQKVLKIRIACLGTEDHLDVAVSYNNLGLVLQGQEDFDGAKEHYQKALNIRIACLGTENHNDVADSYDTLGSMLYNEGDLAGAKEHYQKGLNIRIVCLRTENHPDLATSYDNLGLVLYKEGDFAQAMEHYRKVLNIKIADLGTENHADVASCYTRLGIMLQAQGDLAGAKSHTEKALNIYINFTEDLSEVARSHLDLGDICLSLKEFQQAKIHYVNAKQIHQQLSGDQNDAFFDQKIRECESFK